MQELIQELEKNYTALLANTEFQENFAQWINYATQILPPTAQTCARKIIYQQDHITLYHYQPITKLKSKIPLLINYALINRPSILDLQPDRSFILKLLQAGIDIYLIDWGNPHPEHKTLSLANLIQDYLNTAIKKIMAINKIRKINLLGICQGGVISLCYAALYPKQINQLITMVTPVDFHTENNRITPLLKNIDTEALLDKIGNIPGRWLSLSLQSLKPFRLLNDKYLILLQQNPPSFDELYFFIRMEQWINDCPDHPGQLFHEFIYHFYQNNQLIKNQLVINKKLIDLSQLKMPILNIYTKQDHLVSVNSAAALKDYIGTSNYQEILFKGGHIGVFVSQEALAKIPQQIAKRLI